MGVGACILCEKKHGIAFFYCWIIGRGANHSLKRKTALREPVNGRQQDEAKIDTSEQRGGGGAGRHVDGHFFFSFVFCGEEPCFCRCKKKLEPLA